MIEQPPEQLLSGLLEVADHLHRLVQASRESGITRTDATRSCTPTEIMVLRQLNSVSGVTAAEITHRSRLAPPLVKAALTKLVTAGFVEAVGSVPTGPGQLFVASKSIQNAGREVRRQTEKSLRYGLAVLTVEQRADIEKALPALEVLAKAMIRQ